MTEIEPYRPTSGRSLVQWAEEASAAHKIAVGLCETAFVPSAFQRKPIECAAAILAGSEVGLSPLASLNAYDLIQGRPAPKAITLRALVQSHGHEVWVESATAQRVVVCGRRRGTEKVQTSEWTIDRAQTLGLTVKSQWKLQPQTMLTARATSECCRLVAADVILGIPYSAEELLDMADEPGNVVERQTKKRVSRKPSPVGDEPDLDEPPVEVEASDEPAEPVVEAGESK